MKPKPDFTWSQIDALRSRAGMQDDPIPPGAITVADYATQYHYTQRNADFQLSKLAKLGHMQVGWAHTPSGKRAKFYWPSK